MTNIAPPGHPATARRATHRDGTSHPPLRPHRQLHPDGDRRRHRTEVHHGPVGGAAARLAQQLGADPGRLVRRGRRRDAFGDDDQPRCSGTWAPPRPAGTATPGAGTATLVVVAGHGSGREHGERVGHPYRRGPRPRPRPARTGRWATLRGPAYLSGSALRSVTRGIQHDLDLHRPVGRASRSAGAARPGGSPSTSTASHRASSTCGRRRC